MIIYVFLFLIFCDATSERRLKTKQALRWCQKSCFQNNFAFNCECESDEWFNITNALLGEKFVSEDPKGPVTCILGSLLCNGHANCVDGSDELDCQCKSGEYQCSGCSTEEICNFSSQQNFYQCVPSNESMDTDECLSENSKQHCIKCNNYIDCPSQLPHHDEANCANTCEYNALPCACNKKGNNQCYGEGYTCVPQSRLCNQFLECTDGSDEVGCSCKSNEFQCQCYRNNPVTCYAHLFKNPGEGGRASKQITGCIPIEKYHDNIEDCPDGSDERLFIAHHQCEDCYLVVQRFNNEDECIETSSEHPFCNPATCYHVPSINCAIAECNTTDVICTSRCPYKDTTEKCAKAFQCANGFLSLASKFCDHVVDCPDNSDEVRNRPGFKCIRSQNACVLPQRNLYDNIAHCEDGSDLCFLSGTCFECFDKRLLISPKQVCDGFIDCYDMSDECLCSSSILSSDCDIIDVQYNISSTAICTDYYVPEPRKKNATLINPSGDNSFMWCEVVFTTFTTYDHTIATKCDDRPECKDLSDECLCENPAPFCSDPCHSFYPLGNLYCDGIIDEEAWKYLNNSACPRGFDESNCPHRLKCKAGDKISIDISEKCNGVVDCDNGSDERDCVEPVKENIFSNELEMIVNKSLQTAFWVIGILVIASNSYVIITKTMFLKRAMLTASLQCQNLIILNISFADFIMGIYLLIIAIYSVIYSGYYGEVDHEWRTSFRCSFIGSLAVLSSEASCFLLVVLTSLRLYAICKPLSSLRSSITQWKIYIILAWLLAVTLAVIPMLDQTSYYFVDSIWFENVFNIDGVWDKCDITHFSYRLAGLTNTSRIETSDWASTKAFLEQHYPEYSPQGEFGYYSETSICMPRFYVEYRGKAWEYTFAIITINFISFVYIAASYFLIYMRSFRSKSRNSASFQHLKKSKRFKQKNEEQERKLLKRISRIIFTDFACWIPICVIAYMKIGGVDINSIAYQISAVFLLPINSLLNPILYSALFEKLMQKLKTGLKCYKSSARDQEITLTSIKNNTCQTRI